MSARLFAIGDLHLSGANPKPMEVFGDHWANHWQRIQSDWRARVGPGDIVLIPGDISWAMTLASAREDLEQIGALPGRKILLRGNHDYWWSSISQVRNLLAPGMFALQNDCLALDSWMFCGTRGWSCQEGDAPEDRKIYLRECGRLEMSLQAAAKKAEGRELFALLHFPPFDDKLRDTPITDLLRRYGVRRVVYGHLHGAGLRTAWNGERDGIDYRCVSCDGLNFALWEAGEPAAPASVPE